MKAKCMHSVNVLGEYLYEAVASLVWSGSTWELSMVM